jgi:hypothetical protein
MKGSWQNQITETITKTAPYAFGSTKVVDPEEMDNVCRYVVQQVEDLMKKLAHEMHAQGVIDGMKAMGAEDPEYDKNVYTFFTERLFEKWSKEYGSNATSLDD